MRNVPLSAPQIVWSASGVIFVGKKKQRVRFSGCDLGGPCHVYYNFYSCSEQLTLGYCPFGMIASVR